jgi:hypothetical protein
LRAGHWVPRPLSGLGSRKGQVPSKAHTLRLGHNLPRLPSRGLRTTQQEASKAGEKGPLVATTAVPMTHGPFMDASIASSPAAPVTAPISLSVMACTANSTPASTEALVDAAVEPASSSVWATGKMPGRRDS